MATYNGKHAIVSRPPYEFYMTFVDMRNFLAFIPEDKKQGVEADYDTITATFQGFNIGARVDQRVPYSRITYVDNGAPFQFSASLCFDPVSNDPSKTDFHIDLDVELNFMMKMMIGGKLQDAIDRIAQGLADISEGRMPEGVDPSMFK